MLRVVIYGYIFLITMGVKAQKEMQGDTRSALVNTAQFILPISKDIQEVHMINATKKGIVLLIKNLHKRRDAEAVWSLINLDTALTVYWKKPLLVPFGYTLLGWDHTGEQVQLLFSRKQYENELLSVFKINLNTGAFKEQKISTVFPIEVDLKIRNCPFMATRVRIKNYLKIRDFLLKVEIYSTEHWLLSQVIRAT